MYLLDTDILIYSLKGNEAVLRHVENRQHDPMQISIISLMELYYGAHKSERSAANLARVRRIENSFDILQVDRSIAETFGMIKSDLESQGTPLDDFDLVIAATALAFNLTMVTNNEKHFQRVHGLRLENWTNNP